MANPTVLEVVPGSPADAAGVNVGDELLAIDGVRPSDVIEYQQLVDEADPELSLRRGGVELETVVSKPVGAPVGLRLNASIFDRVQTCDNHCEFCFIYQLPPGMRKSLYLKDDDYRLSFLYGNFTTLTRFTELDLSRVIDERLGPLYVSIHATDPDVRARMLRNPRGATSLRWLRALLDAGVAIHGQIVLCPGLNDGSILEVTCAEIITRYSALETVGIVPLGLSKYNKESALRVHDPATAQRDLEIIEHWQQIALERLGRRMFFASDELYLMAGSPFPTSVTYEGFAQHENGIGMARAFYDEVERLERGNAATPLDVTGEWRSVPAAPAEGYRAPRTSRTTRTSAAGAGDVGVLTGRYGAAVMRPVLARLETLTGRRLRLVEVENRFFGGNVAVSGLMVGDDLARALDQDRGAAVYLLPDVALSGDRFLDDSTVAELLDVAKGELRVVPATAAGLLKGAA